MQNIPIKIIVHHTAVSGAAPQFDAVNEAHKQREFPLSSLGFYVGYHYLIEKSGAIRQAREESEEGAHAIGQNTTSLGVCLAGNFDVEWPTDAQIDSLGVLLNTLCASHEIDESYIFPHRFTANKSCFGSRLPDDWGTRVVHFHQAQLSLVKAQDVCVQAHELVAEPKNY